MMVAERTAVIVGVGQVNDRPANLSDGLDSLGLMVAALGKADRDAGGGWLADIGSLTVVDQISFPELNPLPARVSAAIGARPAIAYQSNHPSGDSPILLLNEALNAIARGEVAIAAIVGGEALRTAGRRSGPASDSETDQNALQKVTARNPTGYRQRYGLQTPVDVYPIYENALRHALGQTLAEGQQETAELWSRFSAIAASNPDAWLQQRRSPEEIVTPSADNRPIAFPYTKFMVANASVNQGAGIIVSSLAEARRRGVPDSRMVYVGRGAAAQESDDILARDRYDRSASLEIVLARVMERNRITVDELDLVELYSCFPCIPKMARRAIGWPIHRAATVFGGLTFGGGPLANYMSHATAAMVAALRSDGGRHGLLFANGGYATRNHAIILSREPLPGAGAPHDFDVQAEADATRSEAPPVSESYRGAATIETYTLFHDRTGMPRDGVIVARTPSNERTLVRLPADDILVSPMLKGITDPVGRSGVIADVDGWAVWQSDALARFATTKRSTQ